MKNKQIKLTILSAAIALSMTLGSVALAAAGGPGAGGPGGPQGNPETFEMGTPPDFEAGEAGMDSDSRPEPPKDENGNIMEPPKDENGNPMEPPKDENGNPMEPPKDENGNIMAPPTDGNGQQGKPGDGKGGPHEQLMEKINAMDDSDTKTDLLNKAAAAEKAMQEFMDAAKEAGLIEDLPEKPSNSADQG